MSSSRTSSCPTTSASCRARHSATWNQSVWKAATNLVEMTRRHVAHPPALVRHRLLDSLDRRYCWATILTVFLPCGGHVYNLYLSRSCSRLRTPTSSDASDGECQWSRTTSRRAAQAKHSCALSAESIAECFMSRASYVGWYTWD